MFEEICLVCGKHLFDYGSAYCSDDCQGRDATSPSISSSSSALSSPHLGYANGGDVPHLVIPSALGSALKNIRGRDAAASPGWLGLNADDHDDDDDGASLAVRAEYTDGAELAVDGVSTQLGCPPYSTKPSALHYTRRPSGTNNHSTVPHVHRRMSSSTSSSSGGHVRGIPRSAPHPSHSSSTEDDEVLSDLSLSSRENLEMEESDVPSEQGSDGGKVKLDADKAKRTRNRASLPAYFSLLQMNSPGDETRSSPVSCSSGQTVARPSPPTPKVALASRATEVVGDEYPLTSSIHATPRGRRRVPCEMNSGQRSDSSYSRSRSRGQRSTAEIMARLTERNLCSRVDGDWASAPREQQQEPTRGRTSVRRNSSPTSKVLLGMEDRKRTLAVVRQTGIFERSESRRGREVVVVMPGQKLV